VGFCIEEALFAPEDGSPNDQNHDVGELELLSVKVAVRPVIDVLKSATGAVELNCVKSKKIIKKIINFLILRLFLIFKSPY
jgi:hypothetical protein